MKQIKRADLHMHSTFSDGVEEPEELVVRAKNNGVELISLTDHDETGGLERMRAAAAQHGLQFVNGVEISADYGEVSIHVVGLDFDPEDEMLQALLSRIRDNRFERAVQMAEKLEKLGMKGVWEGVLKIVTNPRLIGRPHFAAWLAQNGYVEDYNAAFSKYLRVGNPATWSAPKPRYMRQPPRFFVPKAFRFWRIRDDTSSMNGNLTACSKSSPEQAAMLSR